VSEAAAPAVPAAAPPIAAPAPPAEAPAAEKPLAASVADILANSRKGKQAKAEATRDPKAPAPSASKDTKQAAEPPKKPPVTAAPVVVAKPDAGAPEGDAETAKRLARIAKAEDAARGVLKQAEAAKPALEAHQKWEAAFTADPAAAIISKLKPDQIDAVWWKLNEHVLASAGPPKPKDPAELAKEAARSELERIERERAEATTAGEAKRMEEAATAYFSATAQVFDASPAKWPVVAARGARGRGLTPGDIQAYTTDQHRKTGKVPSPAEVLDHFETEYRAEIEAAGYTRKVEAQPGGDKPTTTTNEWQAGGTNPPSTADESKMTRQQLRDAIKRKHFEKRA